jgi:hypothetical protein
MKTFQKRYTQCAHTWCQQWYLRTFLANIAMRVHGLRTEALRLSSHGLLVLIRESIAYKEVAEFPPLSNKIISRLSIISSLISRVSKTWNWQHWKCCKHLKLAWRANVLHLSIYATQRWAFRLPFVLNDYRQLIIFFILNLHNKVNESSKWLQNNHNLTLAT